MILLNYPKGSDNLKKILIVIVLLFLLIMIDGFYFNPKGYKIKEERIKTNTIATSFDGFKIVQFSDLLLGSTKNTDDLEKIAKSINELNPDIVLFTGDLISANYSITENEIVKLKSILKSIECTLYKYAVIGDNDQNNLSLYKDIMQNSDFTILDDESTLIFYKDITPIKLSGLTDINNIDKAINTNEEVTSSYNIVITHYPDYFDAISTRDINLVLAGHSLNGQIRIPFYGPILKKTNANKYIDNYYNANGTTMFVSSGLGTEKINFRLFNKPEINLYRLEKE